MTGLLLRNKAVHNFNVGAHWSISLLFSLVQDLIPHYDVLCDRLDGMWRNHLLKPSSSDNHLLPVSSAAELIEAYNTFVTKIERLGLPDSLNAKPLLDVRAVVSEYVKTMTDSV